MWITKAWYDVLSTDQPWTPTELGRYFVNIKTYQGQSLWAHFIRSCLSIFIVTWKSRRASSLFAVAEMRKCGIHAWIHSNRRRTLSTRLYIARLLCLHNSFRTCDLCVFFPKQFDFSLLALSCYVNSEYFLSVLLTVLLHECRRLTISNDSFKWT